MREPGWHFARNTTWKINDKRNYFLAVGCTHFESRMILSHAALSEDERPAFEAKWTEAAELLFIGHTASWTEAQRVAYRAKLWPAPPPVIPDELFDRNREEEPAV